MHYIEKKVRNAKMKLLLTWIKLIQLICSRELFLNSMTIYDFFFDFG